MTRRTNRTDGQYIVDIRVITFDRCKIVKAIIIVCPRSTGGSEEQQEQLQDQSAATTDPYINIYFCLLQYVYNLYEYL